MPFIDRDKLIGYLSSCRSRERMGYDLARLKEVYEQLDIQLPSHIQVVGTNGKGSVSTKLARALRAANLKVGLFTSPHVLSPYERIQIDGKNISEERFYEIYCDIASELPSTHPTFFDTFFLLAARYFQREKVDVAVFEAGIGARLDATALLSPSLSIITSIGMDHCDMLGDSLDAIAGEKAYAIRPATPVVVGAEAVRTPIVNRAKDLKAPLYQVSRAVDYEVENTLIAEEALAVLGYDRSACMSAAQEGVPFRFQSYKYGGVPVIVDGAHNRDSFRALLSKLGDRKVEFVLGFSSQEHEEAILPLVDSFHLVDYRNQNSIDEGIALALENARERGATLCISGSFYLIKGALRALDLH